MAAPRQARLATLAALANGDDGISEAICGWADRAYREGTISEAEYEAFCDGDWSLGLVGEDNTTQ